jgi:hypothetical protein
MCKFNTPKLVRKDIESHFIVIKGTIHQEEIRIVNLYVYNVGAPNLVTHILLDSKTQIGPNTIIMGDFTATVTQTDRSSRKKSMKRVHN